MTRLAAAVLATAAAATTVVGIVSGAIDSAVRAEIAVSGKGHPFDVRRIRILDGLTPGESYRLPAIGVRSHRGLRTSYRLIISAGAARAERLPPRRWLRFVPAAVVIDAGQSRAVAVRLQLPADAEPGMYGVVLGVRPGGPAGARLTFRIEPAESRRAWLGHPANPAMWVVPGLVGAVLVVFLVRVSACRRGHQTGSKRPKSASLNHAQSSYDDRAKPHE